MEGPPGDDSSSDLSEGVPFEPPSRWESVLAPGLQEVSLLGAGLETSESGRCLEGDYMWTSEDSSSEAFLRVLADGQWWHAAHRVAASGGLLAGSEESWQLAESIGSWYRVPIPGDAVEMETSPAVGLMLLCENFRWATDHERLPPELGLLAQAVASGGPCGAEGAAEVESAVLDGQVLFCYAVCECRRTGARRLELRMPELMCFSSSSAMGALGFAAQYYKAGTRNGAPHPPETVFLPAPD